MMMIRIGRSPKRKRKSRLPNSQRERREARGRVPLLCGINSLRLAVPRAFGSENICPKDEGSSKRLESGRAIGSKTCDEQPILVMDLSAREGS
jgi:hypothetical protein